MEIKNRPNPNEAFPNPKIPSLCFIKNVDIKKIERNFKALSSGDLSLIRKISK